MPLLKVADLQPLFSLDLAVGNSVAIHLMRLERRGRRGVYLVPIGS